MKKQLITLVLSLVCSSATFAQTADETQIKKVIEGEKAANDAHDYEKYQSYWAKTPNTSFLYNGMFLFVGDELWKQSDAHWKTVKSIKCNNTRTDWNIRVKGEAAFVTFSQSVENLEKNTTSETYEERYLEKIEGDWKILNVTAVAKAKK